MGLYWKRARVGVRFEDEAREDERAYPSDAIVIVADPARAADPDFARNVRRIVMLRTFEQGIEEDLEVGVAAGGDPERAFLRNFAGDEVAEERETTVDEAFESYLDELGGFACGMGWGQAPTVQLIVNRCDEVVVGG